MVGKRQQAWSDHFPIDIISQCSVPGVTDDAACDVINLNHASTHGIGNRWLQCETGVCRGTTDVRPGQKPVTKSLWFWEVYAHNFRISSDLDPEPEPGRPARRAGSRWRRTDVRRYDHW